MAVTKQIYTLVNSLAQQSLGSTAVTVVDNTGIVSVGEAVLHSSSATEKFLNTLVERIGKTIISGRRYESMFKDLAMSEMEWGNVVQKIKIAMPTAEADESYGLTNGVSVDMYKVAKPDVTQHLFTTDTPWQMKVTISRARLKTAFLGGAQMEAFISGVFLEMQNAIELAMENLGRNALNNYIGEIFANGTHRAINLLDLYNTDTNSTLTVAAAMNNESFLRYAVGVIKLYSKKMVAMSEAFNDHSATRHTPLSMQKLYVLSEFETKLETQVEYAAFNNQFVSLNGFKEVPYWQGEQSPAKVNVKVASDGDVVAQDNIVACLFDREALGIIKIDEETATTPVNRAGLYYNVFKHERSLYFNDMSENFVVFYLAEE